MCVYAIPYKGVLYAIPYTDPYTVPIKGGPFNSVNYSLIVRTGLTAVYGVYTIHYTTLYYYAIGPAAGFACMCVYTYTHNAVIKVTVRINRFQTHFPVNQGGVNTFNKRLSRVGIKVQLSG